jgi:signal transduction histidine kinase
MLISLSLTAVLFVVANKGLTYGALLVVITAVVASYSVYLHVGAFSSLNMVDNTINYNLYVLSHIVTVWFFGILFEERKRYAEALEEKISQERKKNKEQALFLLQQNRLAQMGELISMIAHQWRQPLNNLSLINQLLVNKFQKGKLDEDGVEYFKVNSKKQIEFMSSTIDDFRNFFKHSETEKEFDIASVVHNVINLSGPVFEKNGISIIYDLEKKCKVLAHENSFAQVVLNIMNNAKDALIERDVKEKQIHVSLDAQGEDVLLSVEDNAGGIDSSIIEKIFDPYFSTKTNKNGTGLGLYMSKMIIEEQMKGDLKVQTTENGAKFIISVKGVCL